jgi:tRNA (guanine10-N2)-dimethyltransferase
MSHLAILGRQPEISYAELLSLYPGNVTRLNEHCAQIDDDAVSLDRLGGSIKLGTHLGVLPAVPAQDIAKHLCASDLAEAIATSGEGKLSFGISLYGFTLSKGQHESLGLELKKCFKQLGRSARYVASKGQLTAAQITHNKLLDKGADIWIVKTTSGYVLASTVAVQDIAAYGERDHGRPARSAKVGMLPPKLAQMMINLAAAKPGARVLDPFCGTGVVLQEAALLGFEAYGSDIEDTLIDMSKTNGQWLHATHQTPQWSLEVGDATSHLWSGQIDAVVTEGYLGPALSKEPSQKELSRIKAEATQLTIDFLTNLAPQLKSGTPVCITLPCWKIGKKFSRVEILDQIDALGYTLKEFLPVTYEHLLYVRADQIVGRQITVLTRK